MAKKDVKPSPRSVGQGVVTAERRSAPVPLGGIASSGLPRMSDRLFSTRLASVDGDATDEMNKMAPTFGDVLLSIGLGVAESQDALDQGMVTAARELSQTKISVISEVIQELDDDGLPDVSKSELKQQEVSMINFISPTVHEWKHMALSMDLSVGEIDYERGMTFHRTQQSTTTHSAGLLWGYVGWFDVDDSTRESGRTANVRQETGWSQGQVRMDALLGPRTSNKFPVPAEVTIGPQIYFSHGSVIQKEEENKPIVRSVDLLIQVRKTDGDANSGVMIEIESPDYNLSFVVDETFKGSETNSAGEVKVTLSRTIPNARFLNPMRGSVVAKLNDFKKSTTVSL